MLNLRHCSQDPGAVYVKMLLDILHKCKRLLITVKTSNRKMWFSTSVIQCDVDPIGETSSRRVYTPLDPYKQPWPQSADKPQLTPNCFQDKGHASGLLPTFLPSACCCHCCSAAKSCPTLHHSMGFSTLGFPVPHHLPKFAQVHVHLVSELT